MNPLLVKLKALVGIETPIAFDHDAGAAELVALISIEKYTAPPPEQRQAFWERERQVCKAVRNGRLVLDYVPVPQEGVRLPAVDHPLYAQSLIYWAAMLKEPIMRVAEACRRAGDGADPGLVKEAARRIAFEARTMQTDRLYLSGYGDDD